MQAKNYWLVVINDDNVTVSAVLNNGQKLFIASSGSTVDWDIANVESLIEATDQSLTEAALNASIPEDSEPEFAAFILPPFWTGIDGKIINSKHSLIESICKRLNFQPLGFISSDDAFLENISSKDNFPASFILLQIEKSHFNITLVYLGKVKERVSEKYLDIFNPTNVENCLRQFETPSSLPPLIYIYGNYSPDIIDIIKNYPWIGKKNIDIFYHLPELKFFSKDTIMSIYSDFVNSQIMPQIDIEETGEIEEIEEAKEIEEKKEIIQPEETEIIPEINEVDPIELGFGQVENIQEVPLTETPIIKKRHFPKIKFKFKFPKIRFHFKPKFSLWLIVFVPLIILTLLLLNKTDIEIFITPYPINISKEVILDSTTNNYENNTIPVIKTNVEVKLSDSVLTTGKQVVGETAKGSIIIYNKQDKTQTLPKGTILTDGASMQFELITPVEIPGSTSDFDQGIIKLGQVKTVISAKNIGPEGNIAKDSKLSFKEFADTLMIAKVETDFAGGTRQEINVVSKQDKIDVETKLKNSIKASLDEKINSDINNLSGAILDTIQIKQNRVEFLRDINETTDTLTANLDATVQVFVIGNEKREEIINSLIREQSENKELIIEPGFTLQFNINQIDDDTASGSLIINGLALPKINLNNIKRDLMGKWQASATKYIKSNIDNLYNFTIHSRFGPIGKILPVSILTNGLNLSVKSK